MNLTVLAFLQLGANAILAVSLAVCKAGAAVKNIPLYKVYHPKKNYGVQCSLLPIIYSLNLLLPIKPSPNERD